ncbi:hypothetical protein P691DRAFT_777698 [Macrolepiota fuliginosa MF-IS2]|uniref:Uncharacterized protein n=1 Tax=Macrolepiota fuliginosa MF-IS2 TaxID=1400762 RepID=A0A9P6C1D0_9AGAR|nr:hypothetical protein P691DRAFT_777698 [Macrolepiota fuliginosa MF-IS2]
MFIALTLSAQPSAQATGTVEAHLIPSLNFGISAIGGKVKAGVFLNLDASATVTLTVEATGAEESTTISPREVGPVLDTSRARGMMVPRGRGMIGEYYFDRRSTRRAPTLTPTVKPPKSDSTQKPTATKSVGTLEPDATKATTSAATKATTSSVTKATTSAVTKATTSAVTKATTSAVTSTIASAATNTTMSAVTKTTTSAATKPSSSGVSFGGCLEASTGLSVNVGADASFFGLFDPSTTLTLFSKDFELFKQCFGDQASQRRGLVRERNPVMMLEGRAQNLKCNSGGQNLTKVVDMTVPKAQIK